MNKDFSKHQPIIDDFRGVVNKANFDERFSAATRQLSNNERFLLKMELKRLAGNCVRAIDLRGLVDGECQLFDFEGQSHFLDDVAIEAFKESVALYGGYTFGVYESVKNAKNSFRNIYKNEQKTTKNIKKPSVEKLQYPAKLSRLTNYPNRVSERMNFSIILTLTLANNQILTTNSIDISVKGIKFKLINEVELAKGDNITIAFTGLEQEFQFTKNQSLVYQVKNTFRDLDTQIIGCKRINIPKKDGFEHFLTGYIQGNKRRYKINLDNSLNALQARSLEQYALVKINELVIFLAHNVVSERIDISPRYVLTTANNQTTYQYWRDKNSCSSLHYLLDNARLKRLYNEHKKDKKLLVFSFIHKTQDIDYLYIFDEEQFKEDSHFFHQCLGFAANQASFMVSSLSLCGLKKEQAYSPYTLSNAITKQQSYFNPPLSEEVNNIIEKLPYAVTINDITSASQVIDYQSLDFEGIDLNRLKKFGRKQGQNKKRVDEIALAFGHQRQEMRFKYITPVNVECEGINSAGKSADFSVSGLKVNLDSPALLSTGDIVYCSFPHLQKITSSFDLKLLPYKVIKINKDKNVINLRVSVKEHQHIGRSFFKLLIDKNQGKLTPDEYAMLTPGLSGALRTLYAVNMATPSVIVQSSGSRYKFEKLVVGEYSQPDRNTLLKAMQRLSERNGYYNLYPLLGNLKMSNIFDQHVKKLLATDLAAEELIYVAINWSKKEVDKAVIIRKASDLNTPEITNFFIKKSLKQGEFYCLQLKLSRSDEPHMPHLAPELAYISAYAIHRGKQLEQEIFSVAGLLQIIDVTQETLLRYGLKN
jgi:hypothetical protein